MTMKLRLTAPITAVLTCAGVVFGIGLTATPAYAQSGEICTVPVGEYVAEPPCLNAWNSGPYLETYTPGASDENFQLESVDRDGTYYDQIEYAPYGTCVGDADNGSPTDARAQMTDACNGADGYGGAYGTLFLLVTGECPYGWALFNVRWGGYVSYSSFPYYENGSPFYLNTTVESCMDSFPG
jgi:hypothetical protein